MAINRRGFVQAAAAGLTVLGGRNALFGQSAPSNTVRVAVMGCHGKGRGFSLLKTLASVPGVEVVTVCDVDARARDEAAAAILKQTQREPKKEKDIRKVLEDKSVDGVLCAAPDHWHATAALMTMKAGKAIYVEKPCSFNAREGEILVEAQAKYGSVFQMGNQRRSSSLYHTVIKEIRGGVIGEPRFARCWYAAQRKPIGKGNKVAAPEWLDWNLWQGPAPRREYQDNVVHYLWHWFHHWGTGECGNNAPHYVDVARWALGVKFPSRVTSGGGRFFYEGDDWEWFDTQSSTFEFPERKFLTWEGLSSVSGRPYEGASTGCMIYGLKGSVLFTPKNVCTLYDTGGKTVREWTSKDVATDATSLTNPSGNLDLAHLGKWAECVRNKDVNTASPALEAHTSILLMHLANIAQRTGETVKTDPVTGKLAAGSPGKELWEREYEKGWEMTV